jgi:hypothetical protein
MFGIRSNGASIRPDTDAPVDTLTVAELAIRVNVLAGHVARLTRELAEVRQAPHPPTTPFTRIDAHPLPVVPATQTAARVSARRLMGQMGRELREETSPDTAHLWVRQALERDARFAPVRNRWPETWNNVQALAFLADRHPGDSVSRFARILGEGGA